MSTLNHTLTAIEQALATRRAGNLVAARVVVHNLTQPDEIPAQLARLLAMSCHWLGGNLATLLAQGSVPAGQITVLGRLDGGQSLLVSVGTCGGTAPQVEFVVFGNHGVLAASGPPELVVAAEDRAAWQLTAEERRLAQLVRQSQQSRQAVTAAGHPSAEGPTRSELAPSTFSIQRREVRPRLPPPYGVLLVAGDFTHQPGYAEALAADPRCRLVGLCDEDQAAPQRRAWNARLAERLQIPCLPNLAEALRRPDIQIVSVCAEPERRARIIVQAARAGKHLYLDKPLCGSVEQAAGIVAAVREANVLGHMFSQVLWHPATTVREVVESGKLGEIRAVHCDLCFAKGHTGGAVLGHSRPELPAPDQFERPDAKRELTNIGVYSVVLIQWLLRRPIRRVFAATENYFFAEHQARNMEDFGQMLLELDGGVTASVTAARTGWHSHPLGGLNRVYLVGSRGVATIDACRTRAEVWSDGEPWLPPARDPEDPMAMWAPLPDSPFKARPKQDWILPAAPAWSTDTGNFLDCLEQGRDSEVTVELAAATTEVLMAAYRSAATRRVVELPL